VQSTRKISAFTEAMVGLTHKLEAWEAELKYSSSRPQYPTFPDSKGFHQVARLDYTAHQLEERMQYLPRNRLFNFFDNLVKRREIRVIYETPVKELVQGAVTKEILGVKAENLTGEI